MLPFVTICAAKIIFLKNPLYPTPLGEHVPSSALWFHPLALMSLQTSNTSRSILDDHDFFASLSVKRQVIISYFSLNE